MAPERGGENSRLVLFGTVKAQNGQPVMTVMDLRPRENGFVFANMQRVNSAYIKTTAPVNYISSSDVLHIDKKRATALLRTVGFQMPIELHRNGSIGSITYKGQNVKIDGVPFSEVVSKDGETQKQNRLGAYPQRSRAYPLL